MPHILTPDEVDALEARIPTTDPVLVGAEAITTDDIRNLIETARGLRQILSGYDFLRATLNRVHAIPCRCRDDYKRSDMTDPTCARCNDIADALGED